MKKLVLLFSVVGMIGYVHAAPPRVAWSNSPAIYDWTGTLVPSNSAWVVRMYKSTDSAINFSNLAPSGDDTWTQIQCTFGTANGADGFCNTIIAYTPGNLSLNDKVYSVIFDSSDVLTATRWAVIDDSVATVTSTSIFYYNPGGAVAGDWQTIPEPASAMMLLFGAGIGTAIHRLRRSAMRR